MSFEKCKACDYRCECCSSHDHLYLAINPKQHCDDCNDRKSCFAPANYILYCPKTGESLYESPISHTTVFAVNNDKNKAICKVAEVLRLQGMHRDKILWHLQWIFDITKEEAERYL